MSTESAKQFVKKMMEDKVFAETIGKLGGKEEWDAFLQKEGFDFSPQEMTDAASELNAVDVVGGGCCGSACEFKPPPPKCWA